MVQPCGSHVAASHTVKHTLTIRPSKPTPRDLSKGNETCMETFKVVVFAITRNWKQAKCPLTEERIFFKKNRKKTGIKCSHIVCLHGDDILMKKSPQGQKPDQRLPGGGWRRVNVKGQRGVGEFPGGFWKYGYVCIS